MMLWLLRRVDGSHMPPWDVSLGFVVRAETEDQARQLASEYRSPDADDHPEPEWLDIGRTSCVPLHVGGKAGVVLRDFLHG
jgi:hypothetical protein